MLDQALEALKTYKWGDDKKVLNPIDEAIVASHGDESARRKLEDSLASLLKSDVPRVAKDVICRKLRSIGTAASVPVLAELLQSTELSHMARYALEHISAPEATQALRDALPKLGSNLKVGVIGSLGKRQDEASVPVFAQMLTEGDSAVSRAAAIALGLVKSSAAAKALAEGKPKDASAKLAATDASLSIAESLLADGKKLDALAIYKGLAKGDQPKHIRLAATRGMLACAGKSG